jgi:hypothetical protein
LYHHNDKSLPAMAAPQAIPVACCMFLMITVMVFMTQIHSTQHAFACIGVSFLRQVKYKPSDLWLRYIIEKEPFCGIKTFQSCVTFSCMFVQVAHTIIDLSG